MSDGNLVSAALVKEAIAGRQRAFTELLTLHRDAVYRLARSYTADADEALDVTQDCFASAFGALRKYDPARPFRVWILRIAVNKCHDWSRRRKVRRFFTFAAPLDHGLDVADDIVAPERAIGDAIELRRVSAAIARLTPPLREVIILRTVDELSEAETADVLGISQKAVETRLYRARGKLIEMLGKRDEG